MARKIAVPVGCISWLFFFDAERGRKRTCAGDLVLGEPFLWLMRYGRGLEYFVIAVNI